MQMVRLNKYMRRMLLELEELNKHADSTATHVRLFYHAATDPEGYRKMREWAKRAATAFAHLFRPRS